MFVRHLLARDFRGTVVRSRVGAGDVGDCEPMQSHERAHVRTEQFILGFRDFSMTHHDCPSTAKEPPTLLVRV